MRRAIRFTSSGLFLLSKLVAKPHVSVLLSCAFILFFIFIFIFFPAGYPPPPGQFPQPMPAQFVPGPSHCGPALGHTATVIGPPGTATTVTVLQGEMFQSAPVQTVCPHCQQAIVTQISHDVGLMNTLFCLFCFFVG